MIHLKIYSKKAEYIFSGYDTIMNVLPDFSYL